MINLDANFFKMWRKEYRWPFNENRQASEKRIIYLENLVEENILGNGSLTTKQIFLEIDKWKTSGKRGRSDIFEKNDDDMVERSIEEVLNRLRVNPTKASDCIRLLSKLEGVRIAIASAFLRFLDPINHRYGIIDKNVARLLNDERVTQFELREDGYIIYNNKNIEEYQRYHNWLQRKAEELKNATYTDIYGNEQVFKPVDVEMSLFAYSKDAT